MYDYALGGKDNFAVDRHALEQVFAIAPEGRDVAPVNRRFLGRAVRFAARKGIRQFLDLGTGFPNLGNVHEVARQISPDARVVYVDYDPVVLTHARALLGTDNSTAIIQADIREPAAILGHPETNRLIDFSRPVAVLFVAILHSITDDEDPPGIVRAFADQIARGSYLILSHLTREGHPPDQVATFEEIFARGPSPILYRSRRQIQRMFDGFELVEPGLVPATAWRPDDPDEENYRLAGDWWFSGVGYKAR